MQFLSKNFSMTVTLSVHSSRLLCCKIFVLKYFRRTSTLRKFFNTKIFPTKISYNENFPIYGSVCELYRSNFRTISLIVRTPPFLRRIVNVFHRIWMPEIKSFYFVRIITLITVHVFFLCVRINYRVHEMSIFFQKGIWISRVYKL